jgi:hypothetical protein
MYTTSLLFYSLLGVYSMDVIRSFSVFCSYKLEFYDERLSVSQKARIKYQCFSMIVTEPPHNEVKGEGLIRAVIQ